MVMIDSKNTALESTNRKEIKTVLVEWELRETLKRWEVEEMINSYRDNVFEQIEVLKEKRYRYEHRIFGEKSFADQ